MKEKLISDDLDILFDSAVLFDGNTNEKIKGFNNSSKFIPTRMANYSYSKEIFYQDRTGTFSERQELWKLGTTREA